VAKYHPDILADATQKLAEAAKRRRKLLRKEARERELALGIAQSKDLQDSDDDNADGNDNASEASDPTSQLSLNTEIATSSRRNSSMTPRMATPRDLLPVSLRRAWAPVDALEEEYVHYLESQRELRFEGQVSTQYQQQQHHQSGAGTYSAASTTMLTPQQLMYLRQLVQHYSALALAYEEEGMFPDYVIMKDRADELTALCTAAVAAVSAAQGHGNGKITVQAISMAADAKDGVPRPARTGTGMYICDVMILRYSISALF